MRIKLNQDIKMCVFPDNQKYFSNGLYEILWELERVHMLHFSLEYNLNNIRFINLDQSTLKSLLLYEDVIFRNKEEKQIILFATKNTEAVANHLYDKYSLRGIIYLSQSKEIRIQIANAVNGYFGRKDLKKSSITKQEMKVLCLTAKGLQPISIAKVINCSVKTVYTHRRNAEIKLHTKIRKLAL